MPKFTFYGGCNQARMKFSFSFWTWIGSSGIQATTTTETATETSVYKCVRVVSKLIALIPSRSIRQMLANFSGLEFFKTVSNFRKRKKIAVVCSSSPKRETRHFHVVVVQWRPRSVQKCVMHVQSCCFANLNLLLFAVLVAVPVAVA